MTVAGALGSRGESTCTGLRAMAVTACAEPWCHQTIGLLFQTPRSLGGVRCWGMAQWKMVGVGEGGPNWTGGLCPAPVSGGAFGRAAQAFLPTPHSIRALAATSDRHFPPWTIFTRRQSPRAQPRRATPMAFPRNSCRCRSSWPRKTG